MSALRHWSERKNRYYTRKFDHDEAKRRWEAGESVNALAREYGVRPNAVSEAIFPSERQRANLYSAEWRTTTCEECGGPAMKLVGSKLANNPDGRILCQTCRGIAKRERFRFDSNGSLLSVRCSSLDCANGERWQPPENFARGHRYGDLRPGGICSQCRSCQTRGRQRYRERHKVPCETCGAPCLPPSEKGPHGAARARCRLCFKRDQSNARKGT